MAYEEIIAYIDSEILLLQQVRALLAQEPGPPSVRRRRLKLTIKRSPAVISAEPVTPAAKELPSRDESVLNTPPLAPLPQPRKRRSRKEVSLSPSALTHTAPANPIAVSQDNARKTREKFSELIDTKKESEQVESTPELTEKLLKERWISGAS